MTEPTSYTIDELGPEARERALAWGRDQAKEQVAAEIRTSLRAKGFRAARLDIEVNTPGEPDGVAFYGSIRLGRVARNDVTVRRPLRFILKHNFAVAAQVGFLFDHGKTYRGPRSMTVTIRADPVSEDGEVQSSWPYEPERPALVNRAKHLLERRLEKAARVAAREMLPLARVRLAPQAILEHLRDGPFRFTASGDPSVLKL